MPVGHSAQCRACNSPRRAEIDARLLAGESARSVSSWLSGLGEPLSHVALSNHRNEHLDARTEAAARVAAVTPVFEAAVEKIVADASVLDEVAGIALRTAKALEPVVSGRDAKPSMAQVVAFNGALSNARQAATQKNELLHGTKVDVAFTGAVDLPPLEDE